MSKSHNYKSISAALENARALSNQTLIRPRDAAAMLGISRKHLHAMAQQPDFPKRIHVSDRVIAWRVADLEVWIETRAQGGIWCAFDMLELKQPAGFQHRATTDVHAMRMIWNWLEATQTQNLLSNVLQEKPSPRL